MKISILGTRGKIKESAPNHHNHSGILVDDTLLFDIGEEKYLEHAPKAIIFTHFHPDHAYFVFENEVFKPKIALYGPEKHELVPNLKVITSPLNIQGYKVTPIPVIHALHLKSYAYLIIKDQKKIMITGDVAWIEKAELEKVPKLDLIITEGSFITKGGMIRRKYNAIFGHTGIPDLIRVLGPYTDRMAFCHFGKWYFEDVKKANETLKNFSSESLEIIPGHDGLQIII